MSRAVVVNGMDMEVPGLRVEFEDVGIAWPVFYMSLARLSQAPYSFHQSGLNAKLNALVHCHGCSSGQAEGRVLHIAAI